MATSSTLPLPLVKDRDDANRNGVLGLIPGIALLAVVGYAGKFIEQSITRYGKAHHQVLPNIEYVLWAILIGVVIANTVGLPRIFRAGVATYEFWLKAGIILLGARFILGDILHLSGISFVLIIIELALALTFMTYLGRGFKLAPKLVSLLAVGSSVCGVSAIIATQGAIEADEEDSSVAIAAILALGAISLVFFPLVGHALHMSDHAYGLWTGLAVDNTAEATAAGALYSDAAGKFAVLAKTCRNATIGFVVLGYAFYWASKGQAAEITNKGAFLWKKFPKFVLGFLFISLLATLGTLDPKVHASLIPFGFTRPQIAALGNLSRWAFLLTFAGVGLRTNLKDLLKQGVKPFVVGAVGEIAIAAITLVLVLGADHYYKL
ncbi:putative sulfate exporter family transporter [Granulicella sp. WH15]|uniref:YeiH family protein n=1 Tax=Granulicella sp. WH15 TaxID=2602070 RepID=UPI00136715A6|nr:putative sulfate exporter family transporter [Granulicella sp. WH15]QHN02168.1 putative sulfate exporter family transporter [Granulicella sp. WH15]